MRTYFVLGLVVVFSLIFANKVTAADFKVIEQKVVETAAKRQQAATDSPHIIETTKTTVNTQKNSEIEPQKQEKETTKEVYWSIFNGSISLVKIDTQLYLRFFSN